MPISHRSIIHQPLDYTAPVDLNLLGRVLQYKQAKFDAGAEKFQGHLDALASMDVVKESDRQYLNAKINNLVSSVNDMGGVDFSDTNTSNQIAGLSSQVYGDENIVNAVANTKKFRYVQKFYQDLKEKKPKEYNPANEDFDFSKFEGWLSDGQVGSSPEAGAGKVTPYTAYRDNHAKLFEKITGNMTVEYTDKGLMYRKDEKTVFTPQEVASAAAKLLTPQERQQIAIDGRYQYKGVDDMSLAKEFDTKIYQKAQGIEEKLRTYQRRLAGAVSVKDKEDYEKLVETTEKELESVLAPVSRNANQLKEQLYYNNYIQGLAERYSFSKIKSTMQANTGEMFRQRQNLAIAEFEYKQKNDAANRAVEIAKNDLEEWTDPITGLKTLRKNPNAVKKTDGKSNDGLGALPGLGNSPEHQRNEFSKEKLDFRKTELTKANDKLRNDYMKEFIRKYRVPDYAVTDYIEDGHLDVAVTPEVEAILKDKMATWVAMTRGESVNFSMLDNGFKRMMVSYQENLKEIQAIDKHYSNVEKTIRKEYGLDKEVDYAKARRYAELKQQLINLASGPNISTQPGRAYGATSSGSHQEYHKRKKEIEAQIEMLGFDPETLKRVDRYANEKEQRREQLISEASTRYNLPTQTISDDKDKNLAKMIAGNATTLQWYNIDGEEGSKTPMNIDNITAAQKGYSMIKGPDGYVKQPVIIFQYKVKAGDDPDAYETRQVPLTSAQQEALGFGTSIKDLSGYRFGLHVGGEVNDIFTTSGKNYDLKYDVAKADMNDPNNDEVFVRVWKGKHPYIIHRDTAGQNFHSFEHAQEFMEKLTQFKTIDEVYTHLSKLVGEK